MWNDTHRARGDVIAFAANADRDALEGATKEAGAPAYFRSKAKPAMTKASPQFWLETGSVKLRLLARASLAGRADFDEAAVLPARDSGVGHQ